MGNNTLEQVPSTRAANHIVRPYIQSKKKRKRNKTAMIKSQKQHKTYKKLML
jgi:hypothetical protein